jgi:hypothetical protein
VANASELQDSKCWNEELVNELVLASGHVAEMLKNSLDISKLEEGKVEFNPEYQSIQSVVDMVVNIVKSKAKVKDVTIAKIYGLEMPGLIEFDRSRVAQVVMNLVGNAVKFTPANGTVEVRATWLWKCGRNNGDCSTCSGAKKNKPVHLQIQLPPSTQTQMQTQNQNQNQTELQMSMPVPVPMRLLADVAERAAEAGSAFTVLGRRSPGVRQ